MEIERLRVSITEDEINGLLGRIGKDDIPVKDLHVALSPDEGIVVTGSVEKGMRVKFKAVLGTTVERGRVAVRVRKVRAGILPITWLVPLLLGKVKEAIDRKGISGVEVGEDAVVVEVDRIIAELLADSGISVRTNLTDVLTERGRLVIVAEKDAAA